MGDATMATLSLHQEGANAAVEMINEMQSLNEKLRAEDHELGLKIGLHEGSALAINADDRVNYFVQAVNIAARVQGLAKSSKIWSTEPIFLASRVQDVFNASGFLEEEQSVILNGIREATTAYKIHRVAGE
jgi:class 3 adenylate cyclase